MASKWDGDDLSLDGTYVSNNNAYNVCIHDYVYMSYSALVNLIDGYVKVKGKN